MTKFRESRRPNGADRRRTVAGHNLLFRAGSQKVVLEGVWRIPEHRKLALTLSPPFPPTPTLEPRGVDGDASTPGHEREAAENDRVDGGVQVRSPRTAGA